MGLREEIISILSKWKLEIQADNHRPVIDVADEILSTQPKLERLDEGELREKILKLLATLDDYGNNISMRVQTADNIIALLPKDQPKLEAIDEKENIKFLIDDILRVVWQNGSFGKLIRIDKETDKILAICQKYGRAKGDWEGETEVYDSGTMEINNLPEPICGKKVLVKLWEVEK